MKNRMRKCIFAAVLALTMAFTAIFGLAGCTPETPTNGGETSNKLTIGIPRSAIVQDYYDNSFTRYIQENLGIEIEFKLYDAGDYLTQFNLECIGGDILPDVLVGFGNMSGSRMYEYGEAGFLVDMKDLIEQYMPTFKAHMDALPEAERERVYDFITHPDNGKIYGLPTYSAVDISDYMQSLMNINVAWLNELGLEKPTTVEELYEVLVAFRDQDPNGNGKADELPMYSAVAPYYYIINAYVLYDSQNPFNITDGKVWSPEITDEYREALTFVKKLYDEGLMKFGMPAADSKSTVSGNGTTAKVGIWCGQPQSDINYSNQVLDQYEALQPLKDETGRGGYLVERPKDLLLTGFLTKDCAPEKYEIAMKFLDYCYDDGVVTRRRHGQEGLNWTYEEPASPNVYGGMSTIRILNSDLFATGNVTWGSLLPSIYTDENYLSIYSDSGVGHEIGRILHDQWELMHSFAQPEETIHSLKLTLQERNERYDLSTKIATTRDRYFSLFMSGKMDLENNEDWNRYLKDMEDCGLSKLQNIYQTAYDRSK